MDGVNLRIFKEYGLSHFTDIQGGWKDQLTDIQGVWIESFYRYLRRMEGSINGYSRRMDRSQFTNIQGECTESVYGYSRRMAGVN